MGEARRNRDRRAHEGIDPKVKAVMNNIGHLIGQAVEPHGQLFALLVFPTGELDGRMNYISNAERADMVAALKELIANFEGRGHDAPEARQ